MRCESVVLGGVHVENSGIQVQATRLSRLKIQCVASLPTKTLNEARMGSSRMLHVHRAKKSAENRKPAKANRAERGGVLETLRAQGVFCSVVMSERAAEHLAKGEELKSTGNKFFKV